MKQTRIMNSRGKKDIRLCIEFIFIPPHKNLKLIDVLPFSEWDHEPIRLRQVQTKELEKTATHMNDHPGQFIEIERTTGLKNENPDFLHSRRRQRLESRQ